MRYSDKKGLLKAYQGAGEGYLAYRLGRLFTRIETPEDMALHNDILEEVLLLVEHNQGGLINLVANTILFRWTLEKRAKKKFLVQVARRVMQIANSSTEG